MTVITSLRRGHGTLAQRVVDVHGRRVHVTVRRSPRARRLTLRISLASGEVMVTIPIDASFAEGFAMAESRASWISAGLARLGRPVPFADGTLIPVNGRLLRVSHRPSGRSSVRRSGDDLVALGPSTSVASTVQRWLRAEAGAVIAELVADKAARVGRMHGRIVMRDTRSRWGSCSARGDLSFSWRLILAPPMVLDYVVAHEVAHLVERGHGPNFWRTVAGLVPDNEPPIEWLRRHGHTLLRYGAAEPPA